MDDKLLIRVGVTMFGLFILWLLAPFAIVPADSRGIMTTFGSTSDMIYGPGIHFRWPLAEHMNSVFVGVNKGEVGEDAASKDLQSVATKVAVNYHVDPVKSLYIFRDLGNDPFNIILVPAVREAMKAITAQYTAEELISKRQLVRDAIISNLKSRLDRHGLIIDEFSITDFQFSKSFNEAIEAKTTAEQLKLKAQMDLQRIEVEAQQKVASAKAEAESLNLQRQQVTPEVLQLRAIEKWDGVLPTVTSGATPFINLTQPK